VTLALRPAWERDEPLRYRYVPSRMISVTIEPDVAMLADPGFGVDLWIEGSVDGGATWQELARASGWRGATKSPHNEAGFLRPRLSYANSELHQLTDVRAGWSQNKRAACRVAIDEREHVFKIDAHHSIAVDAVSSSTTDSGTSLSWSHTCAGSDRYLTAGFGQDHGETETATQSATYNSTSMTQLGTATQQWSTVSLFGLVAPATGANTLALTTDISARLCGGGISFSGVDQTTPTGTAVTAKAAGSSPTVNVSSATGELVVDAVTADDNCSGGTFTVGASQTERVNINSASSCGCALGMSTEAGASTTTMSWSWSLSTVWAMVAVPLKEAGGGGTTTRRYSLSLTGVG